MTPTTIALLTLASMLPEHETPLPPLALANGLPSYASASRLNRIAYEYWRSFNSEGRQEDRDRATNVYMIWSHAEAAVDTRNSADNRRRALRNLISLCGWRAVVTGQLPVPIKWRNNGP